MINIVAPAMQENELRAADDDLLRVRRGSLQRLREQLRKNIPQELNERLGEVEVEIASRA
jgi:FKBP-type peptidyl-prolyl cis-trans isomerase (trigger factor)